MSTGHFKAKFLIPVVHSDLFSTRWAKHVLRRSKTHKRLKERFLIVRNRTKRAHFRGSPLFSSYVQHKNRKKKIQLFLCQLDGWRVAEGKGHETDLRKR